MSDVYTTLKARIEQARAMADRERWSKAVIELTADEGLALCERLEAAERERDQWKLLAETAYDCDDCGGVIVGTCSTCQAVRG